MERQKSQTEPSPFYARPVGSTSETSRERNRPYTGETRNEQWRSDFPHWSKTTPHRERRGREVGHTPLSFDPRRDSGPQTDVMTTETKYDHGNKSHRRTGPRDNEVTNTSLFCLWTGNPSRDFSVFQPICKGNKRRESSIDLKHHRRPTTVQYGPVPKTTRTQCKSVSRGSSNWTMTT